MSGDVVSISGYTPNHQRKEAKPTEDFELHADSRQQAVQDNEGNRPGPAYILQLSKEAQEVLRQKREEQPS